MGEMLQQQSPDFRQDYEEYGPRRQSEGSYGDQGTQINNQGGEGFITIRKASPGTQGEKWKVVCFALEIRMIYYKL